MIEVILAMIGLTALILSAVNIRGFYKHLNMNLFQSTVLGLLMCIPIFILTVGIVFSISTDIVLFLLRLLHDLSYKLVCGLSGTSPKEIFDLQQKFLQKIGKFN